MDSELRRRPLWRRHFRLFALLTCVHATVALGSMMYAMAAASLRFDTLSDPGVADMAAGFVAEVLMAPFFFIWTDWASRNLPRTFEWLLLIANSALWAAAGVAVIMRMRRYSREKRTRSAAS